MSKIGFTYLDLEESLTQMDGARLSLSRILYVSRIATGYSSDQIQLYHTQVLILI